MRDYLEAALVRRLSIINAAANTVETAAIPPIIDRSVLPIRAGVSTVSVSEQVACAP